VAVKLYPGLEPYAEWKTEFLLKLKLIILVLFTVKFYSGDSGKRLGKRTTTERRNDQNTQMSELGMLLPFPADSALTKDKISVIRLTSTYLKFQKFLQDGMCVVLVCIVVCLVALTVYPPINVLPHYLPPRAEVKISGPNVP